MSHSGGPFRKVLLIQSLALLAAFLTSGCGKIGDPLPPDMFAPPAIADVAAPAESQAVDRPRLWR